MEALGLNPNKRHSAAHLKKARDARDALSHVESEAAPEKPVKPTIVRLPEPEPKPEPIKVNEPEEVVAATVVEEAAPKKAPPKKKDKPVKKDEPEEPPVN
jgi:hypothetical protein